MADEGHSKRTEQVMGPARSRAGRLSANEMLAFWQDYRETGDQRLRDRLVLSLAPMVKYVAYRKIRDLPPHWEVDDFISCGVEALIKSIDRYDPGKGATLEQFVWTRIHGAILDELRRHDWAPRSLRRSERDISQAHEQFFGLYGRPPSNAELGDALGISMRELHALMDAIERSRIGSLNSLVLAEDDARTERIDTLPSDDETTDPERSAMHNDARARLRAAFDRLPERDKTVGVLLYVHELTLREIGEILGVSESRVCQIHGELKRKLRTELATDEQLSAAA